MTLNRARVHHDMKQLPRAIMKTYPSDGIRAAFDRAADTYASSPTYENLSLCINLWEVIEQQGCPEGDGSLLNYINIMVRG